jgi:hypothetical protein
MIEIFPVTYTSLRNELSSLEGHHDEIWEEIAHRGGVATPPEKLFVQIGYGEVVDGDLARILGYEGLAQASKPIGVPCEFSAFTWQCAPKSEALIFPLNGLYSHFKEVARGVYDDYEACGSMDGLVDRRGDGMTAVEYLAGGCMECISFCRRNHYALVFQW